jgi:hypothetical protein
MDAQSIVNIGITVAGCFGGWVLNRIMTTLDRLDEEAKDLHNKYVRRDDFIRDIAEIKTMLTHITNKLDGKADKQGV